MAKIKLSVTLDEELHEEIKRLAELDDRTVSAMINKILKDYVSEKERQ